MRSLLLLLTAALLQACPGPVLCGPGTTLIDGTCTLERGGPPLTCGAGTRQEGNTCVPEAAQAASDGGVTGPGPEGAWWVFPGSYRGSADGRFAAFVEMSPTPDGGVLAFQLGALKVRDLDAGTEQVLEPSPRLICSLGGCNLDVVVELAVGAPLAFFATSQPPGMTASPGRVLDLVSGTSTPLAAIPWYERFVVRAPDLSWGLTSRGTFTGNPGRIAFARPLTAAPVQLTTTCVDPGPIATSVIDGQPWVAFSSCNAPGAFTLKLYPAPSGTPITVADVRTTQLRMGGRVVAWSAGTPERTYASSIDAEPPRLLGDGALRSLSPDGRWAVLSGATFQDAPRLVSTGTASGPPVPLVPFATDLSWADVDTLYFRTAQGVHRSVGGAAPSVVLSAPLDELIPVAGGVVAVASTSGSVIGRATDAAGVGGNFAVSGLREAWLLRGGAVTSLGRASLWGASARHALKGKLYFDVLDGQVPAADNGFTLTELP